MSKEKIEKLRVAGRNAFLPAPALFWVLALMVTGPSSAPGSGILLAQGGTALAVIIGIVHMSAELVQRFGRGSLSFSIVLSLVLLVAAAVGFGLPLLLLSEVGAASAAKRAVFWICCFGWPVALVSALVHCRLVENTLAE